jgi:hypothetical protein
VPKSNLEVVRQFEDSMVPSLEEEATSAGGDFAGILELLDPAVVFRPPPSLPHGGDWTGHNGFVKMGETFGEAWNMARAPTFEFFDVSDGRVLLTASFVLESRETGRTVPVEMVELITVRDGRIVELVPFYRDTVPIATAAGTIADVQRAE